MNASGEPLSTVLQRLASELARMSADAAEIEDMVNDLPWDHVADSAGGSATIQSLDYFRQSLDGLSGFVEALSGLAGSDWEVSTEAAVAGLKLASLAMHLSGGENAGSDDDDLELFAGS